MKRFTIMIRKKHLYYSFLLIVSVCSFLLTSCEKDFEWELPLAFTQKNLILSSGTGTTHILVYATKNWNAHFVEKVDWASIDRLSGKENSEIIFSYAANYGVNRKVQLAFETEEHLRDTITLVQSGEISSSDARLIINEPIVEIPASTTKFGLGLDTNLKYDLHRVKYLVTYNSGNPEENWIEEVSHDSGNMYIKLAANPTYEPRVAQIRLAISIPANTINGSPKVVTTSTTITQLGKE